MAGGFRGSGFLLWPSHRSRSHDLGSGIWIMTRSCDLQEERSDWQSRSQATSSASVQFSSAHLASGISHPAKCFLSDRGNSLLGSDTVSEGGFERSNCFPAPPEMLIKNCQPIARLGEEGQISAANNSHRVAMFHLQARRS